MEIGNAVKRIFIFIFFISSLYFDEFVFMLLLVFYHAFNAILYYFSFFYVVNSYVVLSLF